MTRHIGLRMSTTSRRTKRKAPRTNRVEPKSATADTPTESASAVRLILCALGVSFFPVAFVGSLWLIPAFAAVCGVAWLVIEKGHGRSKQLAAVLVILVAYFAPSTIPCWTGDGFCPQWLLEQEIYLLAVGVLLFLCGYAAAHRRSDIETYIFGIALIAYIAIAAVVLLTRNDLTRDIEPPFVPLLIERNDLALLVAWMFFIYALFRSSARTAPVRLIALLIVLVVAFLVSLATQSRLIGLIAILGALFFVRSERRVSLSWWIGLGIVVIGCIVAIDYQDVARLVRRAVLAEGVTSVSSRWSLWISGWQMFLDAPWLGHGLGGFAGSLDSYRHSSPAEPGLDVRFTPWPHNVLIEILVEKGIAGFTAFLLLLAMAAANLSDKARENTTDMRKAAVFLLLALIITGLLDSSTKRLWYLPSLLYIVGMSAALSQKRYSSPALAVTGMPMSRS